jgi:hypothetical protein
LSYWIFKCNPERFRIDARLRHPESQTTWTVSRYRDEIAPGGITFIWRTGPGGGIVAVMRVESDPEIMADGKPDDGFWIDPRDADPTWRVKGYFTHRIACLTREQLSTVKGLEGLSVFHGWQQATQFRVTPREGDILMRLVESAGAQVGRGMTHPVARPGDKGVTHMKLGNLAFACYVYSSMTDYDQSYVDLREKTKPELYLGQPAHREAVLEWLRSWGCRQFVRKYEKLASDEIAAWHGQWAGAFPSMETSLLDLADLQFDLVEAAYAALVERPAGKRKSQDGDLSVVTVGPTGAAKILFALRPNTLVPWDDPIRAHFGLGGSAQDYTRYLWEVRSQLQELRTDCEKLGCAFDSLPVRLRRPHSSLAKLVDEYFWVTITRKCPCPPGEQLAEWTSWLQNAGAQAAN